MNILSLVFALLKFMFIKLGKDLFRKNEINYYELKIDKVLYSSFYKIFPKFFFLINSDKKKLKNSKFEN